MAYVEFNTEPDRRARPDARHRPPILIVPGINNSGPTHWQTRWEHLLPNARRVEQSDWDRPNLGFWTGALLEAIRETPGAVIVAHSLGCAAVAHLAAINGGKGVVGALLVAPADVDRDGPNGEPLRGFSPLPRRRLPFPSVLVASRNDPFIAFERAAELAHDWGSRLVDLGEAGHVNVESGHHSWPAGRRLLRGLMAAARPSFEP
jgi:predicted alpha/beta hydrolase family esterase